MNFSRQVYAAEFGQGLPIADRALIAALLAKLGLDPEAVLEQAGARSPTAASIIAPIPNTAPPAASKPPITAPTKPSNTSSNSSSPLNSAARQSRSRYVYDRLGKNLMLTKGGVFGGFPNWLSRRLCT